MNNGWSARHGMTFEDKDENRSREIDIVATKVEYLKEFGFRLVFYLVIEVKKSERPWIVFTTNQQFNTSLGWLVLHNSKNTLKWTVSEKHKENFYFGIE